MDNKELIINLIKNESQDYDSLLSNSKLDKELLDNILESLISENIIRKTKSKGIYKIDKKSSAYEPNDIDLDLLLNKIKLGFNDKKSLMNELKCSNNNLNKAIDKLTRDKLINVRKSKFESPIEGRIKITSNGNFKFYVDGINNAFSIVNNPKFAFDGDIVLSIITNRNYNEAIFVKIVKRAHEKIVGILSKNKKTNEYYIESTEYNFNVSASVDYDSDYIPDMIFCADLIYDDKNRRLYANNLKYIGNKNDPGMEISKIALEYGFDLEFNEQVIDELKNIPSNVLDKEKQGREDYTDLDIITIDGDDSKDFDDAIYLEKYEDKYFLGVYIADVANYVKEGTNLDSCALKRGTSVYLADRVIPMLPHKLSNGICSLNPREERLVLALKMEIGLNGKLLNYDIKEGIIKSHHRMTYSNVNKILDGDKDLINEYNDIYNMLLNMNELAHILRNIRFKRGGLDFDIDEYSFKLNQDGSPNEIIRRVRGEAEQLIEDFMLIANETIAYHMDLLNLPIVYRIHEKPDQDRLREILNDVSSYGIDMRLPKNDIHPSVLQNILKEINKNDNSSMLSNMILRGMKKAKYSSECLGHYGLALRHYCHFTSPIRRYPDLMTHRLIKKLLLHPSNDFNEQLSYYNKILNEISYKNSLSERSAIECERSVNDMLYAWYMEKYVGNIFGGIITGIENYGIYINIGNGIEGVFLYRNSNLYFTYDEKKKVAMTYKKDYHIGDKVTVKCIFSSKETRKIDFIILGDNDEDNMSE